MQNGYYEGKSYPSYCSGTFFVVPMPLVTELYHMMVDTPSFMPDDAWLGVVYEKLRIKLSDTHSHYAGITSYKRELRLLKIAQSDKFYDNEVFVTILDYAYKTEEVASKIVEFWAVMSSQQAIRRGQIVYIGTFEFYYVGLVAMTVVACALLNPYLRTCLRRLFFMLCKS